MATSQNPYEIITEQIIAALDRGTVPWAKPWNGVNGHQSIDGHIYRGLNPLLLSISAEINGYERPYWAGYKTAQKHGGQVRGGERGSIISHYKILKFEDKKTGEEKTIPKLRYLRVWNVAQIDGLEWQAPEREIVNHNPIEEGERVIAEMPDAPTINIGENESAHYRPSSDTVTLPQLDQYPKAADYYRVAFHELAHSTGHEKRLARDLTGSFGREDYAKEELIAELAAAMVCGVIGIDAGIEQSAAYIAGWRRALSEDSKLIVTASSAAQKAADWITGEASR